MPVRCFFSKPAGASPPTGTIQHQPPKPQANNLCEPSSGPNPFGNCCKMHECENGREWTGGLKQCDTGVHSAPAHAASETGQARRFHVCLLLYKAGAGETERVYQMQGSSGGRKRGSMWYRGVTLGHRREDASAAAQVGTK